MRSLINRMILCFAAAAIAVVPVRSQSTTEKQIFEVASVRPNASGKGSGYMSAEGDRFTANCVPLITMIRWAYRPPDRVPIFYDPNLLIGLPGWATSDCFDVQARAESAVPVEQLQRMMQSLLEERFQLKVRRETREASIYQLVVAGAVHKMKVSEDQTPPGRPKPVTDPAAPPQRGITDINMTQAGAQIQVTLTGTGIGMDQLANRFQGLIGRTVVDKTGIKELFDINVRALFDPPDSAALAPNAPALQAATPGPPNWVEALLFRAIQEQLGLKLEAAKGVNQVLVIESVQKPSEN